MSDEAEYGNLSIYGITKSDLLRAVEETHDLTRPVPQGLNAELLYEVVEITYSANQEAGREMGYYSTLAWGIAIGVMAERHRVDRVRIDEQ